MTTAPVFEVWTVGAPGSFRKLPTFDEAIAYADQLWEADDRQNRAFPSIVEHDASEYVR